MRIICGILLCLVLASEGPTEAVRKQSSRSSCLQDNLLQSCKANEQFCIENNKLLRNHIELLTNSMEQIAINSCVKVYDQVKELEAKQNELQKEIERKNDEITKLQMQTAAQLTEIPKKIEKKCLGRKSGVQIVTLSNNFTFEVLCNSDIAGPGWTVIQQRFKGNVDFHRNWTSYRNGFGDFWDGDFFLGLEKIYRLTSEMPHELYIHIKSFDGRTYFAKYDEFAIWGEDDKYRLITLGRFSGNTSDELSKLKYHSFLTYDQPNYAINNYAKERISTWWYGGRWWFGNDTCSNLNGNTVYWGDSISVMQVKMMIRPN